jgi:hypothetical protein
MNRMPAQNSSFTASTFDRRRPLVIDAPDWFNRARARADARQSFRPRPVPPPSITFEPANLATRLWLRHRRTLIRVLPFVTLPLVFGFGFWARGVVGPGGGEIGRSGESASVGESGSEPAAAMVEVRGDERTDARVKGGDAPARVEVAARYEVRAAPEPSKPLNNGVGRAEQSSALAHAPEVAAAQGGGNPAVGQQAAHLLPAKDPDLADGFSLKTPGAVKQVSAEVIRPASAWFETAAGGAACTTGSCPAPVARLDRKLNTALEWSATPEAAAEVAARDGKLVFLIHVSGNFAQPGFT